MMQWLSTYMFTMTYIAKDYFKASFFAFLRILWFPWNTKVLHNFLFDAHQNSATSRTIPEMQI